MEKLVKQTKNQKVLEIKDEYYEVWLRMKNYNVWHKDFTYNDFEKAKLRCEILEKNCSCYTEIHSITKIEKICKRYKVIN